MHGTILCGVKLNESLFDFLDNYLNEQINTLSEEEISQLSQVYALSQRTVHTNLLIRLKQQQPHANRPADLGVCYTRYREVRPRGRAPRASHRLLARCLRAWITRSRVRATTRVAQRGAVKRWVGAAGSDAWLQG